LLAVTCGRCGAPLDVPAGVSTLTCEYCHTSLHIERRDGVPTSTVTDQAGSSAPAGTEPRSPELDRLDQDWMTTRQQFMIRGREGELRVPTGIGSVAGAAIAALVGAFVMTRSDEAPFRILGAVFVTLALVTGGMSFLRARRYERARGEYRARRRAALEALGDRTA
jgi:LSD1 subclass zinc finger protein